MSKLAAPLRDIYDDHGRVNIVALACAVGESTASFATVVNMTSRAITKNPTSKGAQAAVLPIAAVLQHAFRTFGDQKDAMIWMRAPMSDLEGKSPLEVAMAGHASVVERLLTDIDTGQLG